MKKSISTIQCYLTVLFTVCFIISNILANKQMQLPFGITMTCAIFCFPITYILSDVFSEVYGYRWSRITCLLGFAANLIMVGLFTLAINSPAPSYWQLQQSFRDVLGSTPRILFSSLAAFLIGDFVNDIIFEKMRSLKGPISGKFGSRAILSSLCGELADSLIFIPLAFLGQMPLQTLAIMLITQVGLKVGYEIIIFPITNLCVKKLKNYELKTKEVS